MNGTTEGRLRNLYMATSKHSNYQTPFRGLQPLLGNDLKIVKNRYEQERLSFVLSYLAPEGKTIRDIGGNTGYFSFEMIERGARFVEYVEGNTAHSEFVSEAARYLGFGDRINVINGYYSFESSVQSVDVAVVLNVLHHVGDDYGMGTDSIHGLRKEISRSLNHLAETSNVAIFQMGFNWKGDIRYPIFPGGTKSEMIDFVHESTNDRWRVVAIGIAESTDKGIKYYEMNETNIERNDDLGEFLNRPIFIMEKS